MNAMYTDAAGNLKRGLMHGHAEGMKEGIFKRR